MDATREDGFTLIELLIVIVILGILASVTVFAVSGISASAQARSCEADRQALEKAVIVYKQETGRTGIQRFGPKTDEDRFEKRLMNEKILLRPSQYHKVRYSGAVVPEPGSPCS